MPTLTRLLLVLALLAGAVLSAMGALVAFVRPETVPITLKVPIPALQETRAPAPPVDPSTAPSDTGAASGPEAAPAPVEGSR